MDRQSLSGAALKRLLFKAIREDNLDNLKKWISAGADVNVTCVNRVTPLYAATKKGNFDIVKELISSGADVNMKNDTRLKYTPLHEDVIENNANTSRKVRFSRANMLPGNETPLNPLVYTSSLKVLKAIMSIMSDAQFANSFGKSALHIAAENGNLNIAEVLISANADVNLSDHHLMTPLNLAVKEGHFEVSKLLISCGADVNKPNKIFCAPLHYAVQKGHLEILKLLISSGANLNMVNIFGAAPLHVAAQKGRLDIAEMLILSGADFRISGDSHRFNVLLRRSGIFLFAVLHNLDVPDNAMPATELLNYRNEVRRMSKHKFGRSKISLKNFLLERDLNKLVGFVSNVDVESLADLESTSFILRYPKYATMIRDQFKKAKTRQCLLFKASIVMQHSDLERLSVEMRHTIARFLSDDDLKNLIRSAID